jgi:DNA-binding HxlR family transcriptional regulator
VTTTAITATVPTDEACRSFQPAMEFLGRRWIGMVLLAGQSGARRFSQYRAFVPGISDRLLTQRLKELEQRGLIERTVVPSTPVQIIYSPSQRATELLAAVQPLMIWSTRNAGLFD